METETRRFLVEYRHGGREDTFSAFARRDHRYREVWAPDEQTLRKELPKLDWWVSLTDPHLLGVWKATA